MYWYIIDLFFDFKYQKTENHCRLIKSDSIILNKSKFLIKFYAW